MNIKRFNEFKINEDTATVASPGSGTAVGGPGSSDGMSFTSAMGVSASGGDSGTSFSTNSSVSGMGPIVSAQPSSTPGSVRGSTKGSGDIGSNGGTFTKTPSGSTISKNKKKKKNTKRKKAINKIENLYTTNYSQEDKGNGKVVQKWKTFK